MPWARTPPRSTRSRGWSTTCWACEESPRRGDIEPEQLQRQITLARPGRCWNGALATPAGGHRDRRRAWADTASADLLRRGDRPACRPSADAAGRAAPRCPRAARRCRRRSSTIALEPLGAAAGRRAGGPPAGGADGDALAPVRQLVAARAGGNLLFVEEIVRSLAGSGLLVRQGERWRCKPHARRRRPCRRRCTACCCRASIGWGRKIAACCRRRPCWAPSFDAALLQRIASDPPSATDAALRPPGGRRPAASAPMAADPAGASPTRCCTRWPTRTCCWRGAANCMQRAGRALGTCRAEASRRPSMARARPRAAWPNWRRWGTTGACRPTRRAARATCWPPATGRAVYANDDAMRHYEPRAAHAGRARRTAGGRQPRSQPMATRRPRAAWPTCSGLQGGQRAKRLQHMSRSVQAANSRRGAGAPGARAAQDRRTALEAGDRERAGALASTQGWRGLGEQGDADRARPPVPGDGPAGLPRRRQRGRAWHWRERALGEVPMATADGARDAERTAPPLRAAPRPATRSASRWPAWAGPCEAVEQIEQQRRPGRGARPAAGGLPRLHQPGRAVRDARSAAQHRDLPARAGDRAQGRRPRLSSRGCTPDLAVAYCALTNRCEDEGIEAAQTAASLDRRLGLRRSPRRCR